MPIDGTPRSPSPTSSETFVSATPLAPNGSFQVPIMVAKKEMPLGTTRTPPMNSSGLESMVTSTAPDTEIDTFSGSGTSSNSAFLSTTPSVMVTSPMPAASDRSLSLVPTWALTSSAALPRNLSAPSPDRSSRPSTSRPRLDPGAGDRLQLVEGERGVVEGGDDDQRVGQVHAVQPAQRGRQRGELVVVVQADADGEAPRGALADDRLHPLEARVRWPRRTPRSARRRWSVRDRSGSAPAARAAAPASRQPLHRKGPAASRRARTRAASRSASAHRAPRRRPGRRRRPGAPRRRSSR